MNEEKRIYDELSKIAQKHEFTNEQLAKKIVANSCYPYEESIKNPRSNTFFWMPTQPDSERNYDITQELKDIPDVLVIDYFGKI